MVLGKDEFERPEASEAKYSRVHFVAIEHALECSSCSSRDVQSVCSWLCSGRFQRKEEGKGLFCCCSQKRNQGPGKSVAFLAASERERSEWIKQIEASLQWFRDQSQKVLTRVKREVSCRGCCKLRFLSLQQQEKEGFLLRGKLKIWAVVKVGSFMMYDSKSSKKAITTLQLGNCGLLETKGKEGFLIFTTVPSLEVLQCSGRKNEGCEEKEKEKTNFSAQILAQAECCEWFQAVLLNIVRANNAATEKEAKNKVEAPGIAFQSGSCPFLFCLG